MIPLAILSARECSQLAAICRKHYADLHDVLDGSQSLAETNARAAYSMTRFKFACVSCLHCGS